MHQLKTLTVLFMLLTLAGQASMATVMPMQMNMDHTTAMSMGNHDMKQMDSGMADPCQQSCSLNCSMANCSAALLHDMAFTGPQIMSKATSLTRLSANQNRYPNSLYRPPIYR